MHMYAHVLVCTCACIFVIMHLFYVPMCFFSVAFKGMKPTIHDSLVKAYSRAS